MTNSRLSKKQQDLQLAEARDKKRKELEADYYDHQKTIKKLGWEKVFGTESLEEYVKRRFDEWNEVQPVPVSGMYFDRQKVTSTFQQRFIHFLRECEPAVLEELRDFVPLFEKFFGNNKENYLSIFFRQKMEFYELNYSFENTIDNSILQTVAFKFKPDKYENYPYDYLWGEYKILLYFLYILFVPATDEAARQKVLMDLFGLLREAVGIQRKYLPENYDESVLQNFYNDAILRIVKEFTVGDQRERFLSNTTRSLEEFLKDISAPNQPDIPAFIELQFEMLNWAEKHKIGKDWLLRYAYFFVSQLSKNPDTSISDIEIPPLNSRSLAAGSFEFRFNGWSAGDESKEDYERRVTERFKTSLSDYFSSVGRSLKLDKKKRLTKPMVYDRVKWLVRWTVQGWDKDRILAEIDKEFQKKGTEKYLTISTIEKAFIQFKEYNLPVRD